MSDMVNLMGMRVSVSKHATKEILRWPEKQRSKRLVKKLTKLRGAQRYREPCFIVLPGNVIVVHPDVHKQLLRNMEEGAKP